MAEALMAAGLDGIYHALGQLVLLVLGLFLLMVKGKWPGLIPLAGAGYWAWVIWSPYLTA